MWQLGLAFAFCLAARAVDDESFCDAEAGDMKVAMLQSRTSSLIRERQVATERGSTAADLTSQSSGRRRRRRKAPKCPEVGTLNSEVVQKPGFSSVCKWRNVRYARIKTDEPTGKRTSGTHEEITYGDWGPSKMTSGFKHIKSDQRNGPVLEGTIRCFQMQAETNKTSWSTGQSDCLGMQIWAPADGSKNIPVAIWIHGGMFVVGSGDEWAYDGARLSSRGLVVVSINYRLGPYGFSTYDAVTRNNGIRDQRMAIEWVHKHIAEFGGDPSEISIFGESAGGTSVAVQALYELHHPSSPQLIKRVISQSNPLGIILENPSHKRHLWEHFEMKHGPADCDAKLHCKKVFGGRKCNEDDAFQCMKDNGVDFVLKKAGGMMVAEVGFPLPGDPILEKAIQNFYGYGPCLDDDFLVKQPMQDIVNLKIPSMQGTNLNEGVYFAPIIREALSMAGQSFDLDEHENLVQATTILFFGSNIYQHYKNGLEKGYAELGKVFTDFLFSCPMRSNLGKQVGNVYRYQLHSQDACSAPSKRAGDCGSVSDLCKGIACHANEVPVVFGSWGEAGSCCSEVAAYEEYSRSLMDAWYAFLSGREPWSTDPGNMKVKVTGMKQSGGLASSQSTLGDYEVDAVDAVTGGLLTGGRHHVCDRMMKKYNKE